jgi:hypothetical protein
MLFPVCLFSPSIPQGGSAGKLFPVSFVVQTGLAKEFKVTCVQKSVF